MITQTTKVSELNSDQLKILQSALKKLGYYNSTVDGVFGKNTGEAFARWKTDNFLNDTTLIGQTSWVELQKDAEKINVINWSDFTCKVSKYFTVSEVTQKDSRRIPKDKNIQNNILKIAKELDKIREEWGSPIGVTSWYRPPAINKSVGGVSNSQHLNGSAVDIYPIGGDIYKFQTWLDKRWTMALGYGAKKNFVHLDLRAPGQRIRWDY